MQKINKKADVSITILVFMVVVLTGTALFIFASDTGKISAKITDARFLDEIYLKENEINFYINEIIENSSHSETEEEFIDNFKIQLERYKDKDGNFIMSELSQLESQITEDNIKFENNKIEVEFVIRLEDKLTVKEKKQEKEVLSVVYIYSKKFERIRNI